MQNRYRRRSTVGRPQQRFGFRSAKNMGGKGGTSAGIDHKLYTQKAEQAAPPTEEVIPVSFADLDLIPQVMHSIERRSFTTPTPIQAKTIPHILQGQDVIGLANTGTGKTGAFLLPILQNLLTNAEAGIALIMVPTRELGLQIQDELRQFAQGMSVRSALLIGGSSMHTQIQDLKQKPQIIIGTPGRLKDMIERRMIPMNTIRTVVLDEADRMVDMGFIKDITHILSHVPSQRQSLFFSATLPKHVVAIVEKFMQDPVTVSVITQQTAAHVDQDIVKLTAGQNKVDVLVSMLEQHHFERTIVFGRTKRGVEVLSQMLVNRGIKAVSIHGDKPQRKREQAIRLFKSGKVTVLVATDVAARGIDIPNVSHVINYDEPATYEDYIHRIGRTGRGDQKGQAYTFV